MRQKTAKNLGFAECARKFDVFLKLLQHREEQYEAGELTVAAGHRAASPEQAEITRLRAELSRTRMEIRIQKKQRRTLRDSACEVRLYFS